MNSSELLSLLRALAGNPHDCCWSHLPFAVSSSSSSSSSEAITACTWITEPYAQAISGTFYLVVRSESGDEVPFFVTYNGEWSIEPAPSVCELPTAPREWWEEPCSWTGLTPSDVLAYEDSTGHIYGENGVFVADTAEMYWDNWPLALCYVSGVLTCISDSYVYTIVDGTITVVHTFESSTYWARTNQSGTGFVRRIGIGSQSDHEVWSLEYVSSEGVVATYVETIDDGWTDDSSYEHVDAMTPPAHDCTKNITTEEECMYDAGCDQTGCYESKYGCSYPGYYDDGYIDRSSWSWSDRLYYPGYQKDVFVYGTTSASAAEDHGIDYYALQDDETYLHELHYTTMVVWVCGTSPLWGGGWKQDTQGPRHSYVQNRSLSTEQNTFSWPSVSIEQFSYEQRGFGSFAEDWPGGYEYYEWSGSILGGGFVLVDTDLPKDTVYTSVTHYEVTQSWDSVDAVFPEVDLFIRTKSSCTDAQDYQISGCDTTVTSVDLYQGPTVLRNFGLDATSFIYSAFNQNGKALFTLQSGEQYYLFGFADGVLTDLTNLVGPISLDPELGEYNVYNLLPVSGGIASD